MTAKKSKSVGLALNQEKRVIYEIHKLHYNLWGTLFVNGEKATCKKNKQ